MFPPCFPERFFFFFLSFFFLIKVKVNVQGNCFETRSRHKPCSLFPGFWKKSKVKLEPCRDLFPGGCWPHLGRGWSASPTLRNTAPGRGWHSWASTSCLGTFTQNSAASNRSRRGDRKMCIELFFLDQGVPRCISISITGAHEKGKFSGST